MSNLLYGGISYPNTAFVFDRVYTSFKEANDEANSIKEIEIEIPGDPYVPPEGADNNTYIGDIPVVDDNGEIVDKVQDTITTIKQYGDGVLLNRYVLVAYTPEALPQNVKHDIEKWYWGGSDPKEQDNSEAWRTYAENYRKDNIDISSRNNAKSYDRHVLRKCYDQQKNIFYYEDIAIISTTLDTSMLKIADIDPNDTILSIDNGKILKSTLNINYDKDTHKLELLGNNDVKVSVLDETTQLFNDRINLNDSVLYIDRDTLELSTDITLNYMTDEEGKHYIELLNHNRKRIGEPIDASDFVKDSFLSKVEYVDGNSLKFTFKIWDYTDGKDKEQEVLVPIDIMDAGAGISIDGITISANVDPQDHYLKINTNNIICTQNIANDINQARETAIDNAKAYTNTRLTWGTF